MSDTTILKRGRPPSPATDFGRLVLEVMESRGISGGTTGLSEAMSDPWPGGYKISQQAISKIISGKSKASRAFARQFARKLNLSKLERGELSYLYLWGQGED